MKSFKRLILLYLVIAAIGMSACADKKSDSSTADSGSQVESTAEDNVSAVDKDTIDEPDVLIADKDHTGGVTVLDSAVTFGMESGFYDDEISLELSCADGLKIYYTTDGSIPTTDDRLYEGAITLKNKSEQDNLLSVQEGTTNIQNGQWTMPEFMVEGKVDKANVIRAAAFNDNGERGPVVSHTYFVGIDRASKYGDVPVISLMTDAYNLFDYDTGIYTLGKYYDEWLKEDPNNATLEGWQTKANFSQKGREWERPVYVEYLNADNSTGFAQDMGIRIMGAASRNEKQKSLRLVARKDYGEKNVSYEVIPDNTRSDGQGNVEKYKTFVLRNGGNDCNYTKIRDPYLQSMVADRDFETQQSTPVVVFLDGEFWGMYCLEEDYSADYFQYNYNIDDKNIVMIKTGELEEGEDEDIKLYTDMYDFITGNDMTDVANYEKACDMLDMQSFVDYCAFNIYIDNEDSIFENNNWRMWRVREPDPSVENADGLWRMMVYDTEYSTGIYMNGQNYKDNAIKRALDKNNHQNVESDRPAGELFRSLIENEDFKKDFITTLCDLRNINFEKEYAIEQMNVYADEYRQLTNLTYERFGPDYANMTMNLVGLDDFMSGRYNAVLNNIRDSFKPGDTAAVTVKTDDASKGTVVINRSKLDLSKDFTGDYYPCYPVEFTAVPEDGHKFVKWECTGATLEDDKAEHITVNFDKDIEIKAVFE